MSRVSAATATWPRSGFHLVRHDEEDALPLPRDERELPLLIADRAFAADGSLRYPSLDRSLTTVPGVEEDYVEGVLGDVILVNGAPWPVAEVPATRHRLRLLNGSNARRYDLALDPRHPAAARSPRSVPTRACSTHPRCTTTCRSPRPSGTTWWSTSAATRSAPR